MRHTKNLLVFVFAAVASSAFGQNGGPNNDPAASALAERIFSEQAARLKTDDRIAMYYIDPTANDSATVGVLLPSDETAFVDTDPFSSDVDFNQFGPATGGPPFWPNWVWGDWDGGCGAGPARRRPVGDSSNTVRHKAKQRVIRRVWA